MSDLNTSGPLEAKEPTLTLVGNEADVLRFHALHLAPLGALDERGEKPNLSFIVLPLARKKYFESLATSNVPLSAKPMHASASAAQFLRLLRRYEVKRGVYVDKNDNAIPQQAIGMYISVNACDEVRAYLLMQSVLNQRLYDMSRGISVSAFNVKKEFHSALHKSALPHMCKYDVDSKQPEHIDALRAVLRDNEITLHLVVESRGGYHVVLDNRVAYPRNKAGGEARAALKAFVSANADWISAEKSAAQIVIPGTYQGGFLTRIVDDWLL